MQLVTQLKRERLYVKALGASYVLSRRTVEPGLCSARTRYGVLYFRPADSDLLTFWYTLGAGEYSLARFGHHAAIVTAAYDRILAQGKTPLIVDAGANIGAASVWFAQQFPKARIVAVEPDPMNARICRLNTQGRNVEVVEAAIGARPGSVSLIAAEESWGVQTVRGGDVPIVTIPQLIDRVENSELLIAKVDIEGFESDLFAEETDWIQKPTAIFLEPHDWMLPGRGTSRSFRQAIGPEFEMLISGENLIFVRCGQPADHRN
ncbi:MAG: FkbM family methyltransferase [Phenylobacterium sp.]